jgi:clan AA aspartic protease (TIGR02281 family)
MPRMLIMRRKTRMICQPGRLLACGLSLWVIWVVGFQAPPLWAALYRWSDAQGRTQYSTSLPTAAVENLEVKDGDAWRPYRFQDAPLPQRERAVYVPEAAVLPIARAEIPYRKQQHVILVQATINAIYPANFMVDTGATYTIISPAAAEHLGLSPDASAAIITLQTASGTIQAPLVNLASVTLNGLTVPNVMAAVHDLDPSGELAGVLGLNLLNLFTMTVDAGRHTLVLEAIRPLSRYEQRDCAKAHALVARGRQPGVRPEQEIAHYQQAIALCHDFLEAYLRLADAYYLAGRYADAIDQSLTIVQLAPDDPNAHYRLGVLYALADQIDQAVQAFHQALALDPTHQEAQAALKRVAP